MILKKDIVENAQSLQWTLGNGLMKLLRESKGEVKKRHESSLFLCIICLLFQIVSMFFLMYSITITNLIFNIHR